MKRKKADEHERSSVRPLHLVYGVAALVFLADQLTKVLAIHFLKPKGSVPLLTHFFHLSFVENSGIAFGLFRNQPGLLIFLITASVFVLFMCASFFREKPARYRITYGFILGGALGNLMDRIRFQHVIDFLDFRVWPVFNLADSFITIGVALFILFSLRGR